MFHNISPKQALAYGWWAMPPTKDYRLISCHGAIRTGKTSFASFGFFDWAEETVRNTPPDRRMKGWNQFGVISTTKDSVRDNVINPLIEEYLIKTRGYLQVHRIAELVGDRCVYHHHDSGTVYVKKNGDVFRLKYLGASNKAAVNSFQGRTWRGSFIDEAALISLDLLDNIMGRHITFKDYKLFHTANPEGDDSHPYYENYILNGQDKDHLVINFHLLDNPVFDEGDVAYYEKVFTPEMYKRNVLGQWVRGTGVIFKKFDERRHVHKLWDTTERGDYVELVVGVDYGEVDSTVFELGGLRKFYRGWDFLREYFHKNGQTEEKDITDYLEDFFVFVHEIKEKFNLNERRRLKVELESATHGRTFYKLIKARCKREHINWLEPKLVDKSPQMGGKGSVRERISTMNLMLGADFVRIDQNCTELIKAIKRAEWLPDKEERKDDSTTEIGPLDAGEYAYIRHIPKIWKRIETGA